MSNIVFITGASSDIGIELIRSIKDDCLIIAHYNSNNTRLLQIQEEINNKVVQIQADFSSERSLMEMLDKIESKYGTPDKIIHLASPKFKNIRFKDVSWNNFQNELNVSLGSIAQILNCFLPKLAIERRGRVVTILSSVTFGVPPKALSQYTTVKYALLGLMKALASEYSDKNITVNCISPSMIETQFLSQINERIIEMAADAHPLKRNAVVRDIIPVLLMLLSDEAAYLNGVNIPITGGSNF